MTVLSLSKEGSGAHKHLSEGLSFLYIVNIYAVIAAGGVDHLPATQADPYMRDLALAAALGEEDQVTHFEGWLDRPSRGMLHICIARNFDAHPAMEQAREA